MEIKPFSKNGRDTEMEKAREIIKDGRSNSLMDSIRLQNKIMEEASGIFHKEEVVNCLLCQRNDGLFLSLYEQRNTTDYNFVKNPLEAKRIKVMNEGDDVNLVENLKRPKEPTYYFENSHRARELWTKDCKMVPFKITIKTKAEAL